MRFPAYYPLPAPPRPTTAERARDESLRDLAAAYGVSHETVRNIVRRVLT